MIDYSAAEKVLNESTFSERLYLLHILTKTVCNEAPEDTVPEEKEMFDKLKNICDAMDELYGTRG